MTKRLTRIAVSFFLIIGVAYLVIILKSSPIDEKKSTLPEEGPPKTDPTRLEIAGKKVMGLSPGREREELERLMVRNHPSPEWRGALEESLRHQGGSAIKDITIEREDSFIWSHEGIALHVETAKVTLRNQQDELSSFRVMVDAQNGKILQTWDPPVIDKANPREGFRLKLDPRYHNQ